MVDTLAKQETLHLQTVVSKYIKQITTEREKLSQLIEE